MTSLFSLLTHQSRVLPRLGVVLLALVPVSLATPASAAGLSREILDHQISGDCVAFSLSLPPIRVSLQGLMEKSGRWKNLAVKFRPGQDLTSLKVPAKWRGARLRVVATYPTESGDRVQIESKIDATARSVVFTSTSGARLFSVESRLKGSAFWSRVSTVAAPESPRSIRVALPSSLAVDTEVRVMAISGPPRQLYPFLKSSVPAWLRSGPSVFAPASEVISSLPLASVQTDASVASDARQSSGTMSVEETDIWKIRGKNIYFFNRLRGLQLIDASDPSNPQMSGCLPLAGSGEEMYLLGSDAAASSAVLITGLPWSNSQSMATRLYRANLQGENPTLQSSLDLPGYYIESRLVGGILHVITGTWYSSSGEWKPKTYISAIDVSQDSSLTQLHHQSPEPLDFSPAQVGSTGKYLWVAGETLGDWAHHTIVAYPFKTDGLLGAPLQTVLDGRILDKFKVGDTADGLAAVVQSWNLPGWQQVTSVQTYGEANGELVSRGKLELVRNESLFATRFDGDRLYAVTFQQKDPLWIVDLSDPVNPDIKGHLEVPGWSSFIQPVGDTLIAVGRDGGKVQVSLFDVSDEDQPVLAKRVDVGSGWSWTEAEWNEKAVKILPEAGLIMIPVIEWDNGVRKNCVRLIDFDASSRTLSPRGAIDHDFAPRRAALMDEQFIASVSNRELLLVDASDRDNPAVTADVTLAFGVDRVAVANGTVFMFEDGGAWSGGPATAILRTAYAGSTDDVISQIALPCRGVAAAEIIGGRLVVVEASGSAMVYRAFDADNASQPVDGSALSVWSLDDAANPQLISRFNLPFDCGSEVTLLPVEGGRVAVTSREQGWNYWVRPMRVFSASGTTIAAADGAPSTRSRIGRFDLPWLGWGGQGVNIAVADVSGDAPSMLGSWELSGEGYSTISEIFSAGDLLAFSFDRREPVLPKVGNEPAAFEGWSSWESRSWLQIVDLADSSAPMPWSPVQLPGQLVGISWLQRSGGVVFARSGSRIAALGFDGENASVAAEVDAGSAVAMQGSTLYALDQSGVAEWKFSQSSASWTKHPGWNFESALGANSLHISDGAVIAAAYDQAWVLREDGSVLHRALNPGSDLARASQAGNVLIVPAGEYGALCLPLAP